MTDATTNDTTPTPEQATPNPPRMPDWSASLLDEVRALDAKPQARALFGMVRVLPGLIDETVQELRAESIWASQDLCAQITAGFAAERAFTLGVDKGRGEAEHEARGKLVEQLNAVNAGLQERLSALERRQQATEGTVATISAAPTPAPLDSAQLAAVVAQQVLASLPSARRRRVQEVERDRDGNMSRLISYDGDELLDDLA
jgi:hypothetical protein